MDRHITEGEIHWIVTILNKNADLVTNRERLYTALGLPYSEIEHIKFNMIIFGNGADGFFRDTMMKWISSCPTIISLENFVQILRSEKFVSTADTIEQAVKCGNYELNLSVIKIKTGNIWFDVPQRILNFTGRVQELEHLHETIIKQINEATVISTLSGLGGIGKTTLSVEYAWTYYETFYCNIIWINSETIGNLTDSFKRLAEKLKISGDDSKGHPMPVNQLALLIYERLQTKKSLIIFDNVESYSDIKAYLPQVIPSEPSPFVLLTSRNRSWNDKVHAIPLNVFTEADSIDFLKNYLKLESPRALTYAKSIANLMQNMPLGIRQAGAYIKLQHKIFGSSIEFQLEEYIFNWESNFKTAAKYEYWTQTEDQYEKTVYVTWNVTLEKIRKQNKLSIRIMELVSYLNPDNIPIELFRNLDHEGILEQFMFLKSIKSRIQTADKVDKSEISEAIELLHSYSVINKDDTSKTFSVHRLLQKVIQIQTEEKSSFSKLKEACSLIKIPLKVNIFGEFEDNCLIHAQFILTHLKAKSLMNKSNDLEQLINNKHRNIIKDQLFKLINIFETRGHGAAFEAFYEFDKAFGSSKFGGETKLYIENYFGGFLSVIYGKIISECASEAREAKTIAKLVEEARPIFERLMECLEKSSIVDSYLLTELIISLWRYSAKINVERFDPMEAILNILETIILYRRNHYFRLIGISTISISLFDYQNESGRLDKTLKLVNYINQMLNESTQFHDSFIESGLADFLLEFQDQIGYVPQEFIFLVLKTNQILFERNLQGIDPKGIVNCFQDIINCLVQLNRFKEVLEFLKEFDVRKYIELFENILIQDKLLNICGLIFRISAHEECENSKLGRALLMEGLIILENLQTHYFHNSLTIKRSKMIDDFKYKIQNYDNVEDCK